MDGTVTVGVWTVTEGSGGTLGSETGGNSTAVRMVSTTSGVETSEVAGFAACTSPAPLALGGGGDCGSAAAVTGVLRGELRPTLRLGVGVLVGTPWCVGVRAADRGWGLAFRATAGGAT
jgi:hypothetical protein